MFRSILVIFGLMCSAHAELRCQEPIKASLCELKANPGNFNQKLIEVSGFISHGFEDFGMFDVSCPSWPYIWLEYGGTKMSGTMYCCGVSADRSRPTELKVEGVAVPLTEDDSFKAFDKLIFTEGDTVLHATLVGRFFAGRKSRFPNGEIRWRGYGHMGCCSLFAIQRVISVAAHDRKDLDYRSSPDQPSFGKMGCGFKDLVRPWPYEDWVAAQRSAELQGDEATFDNPREVAGSALVRLAKLDRKTAANLAETRSLPGRVIYELRIDGGKTTYMIVVSRPYLLSFYAKDSQRIAWVVIGAYESSCEKGNSVTRIQ